MPSSKDPPLDDGGAHPAAHAAAVRSIRTVLNVDQTSPAMGRLMEATMAPNESPPSSGGGAEGSAGSEDNTFLFTPSDPMLRVTKSKFSCIRHCCPVDDVFFSSEKEFDVWHDVLKTATTELWDGSNVSLMLHGPAPNMSLFALPSPSSAAAADQTHAPSSLSSSSPGAGAQGPRDVPSQQQPTASPMKTHHHSALENILRALLREIRHREVPKHYTAHVAVGACLMHANGAIEDITPTPPPPVISAQDAALLEAAALQQAAENAKMNGAGRSSRRGGAGNSSTTKQRGTSPPKDDITKSRSNVATSRHQYGSGNTMRGGQHAASNANSPITTGRQHNNLADDGGGQEGADAMRMFPVPNEAAVEAFAAHISPICSRHMTVTASAAAAAEPLTTVVGSGGDNSHGNGQKDVDKHARGSSSPLLNSGGGCFNDACGPLMATFSVASPTGSSSTGTFGAATTILMDNEEENSGSGGGAVLVLSVQLHQECSISKPRTSYIRIMQLMRAPTVVEEVLLAVSRNKPLPAFASSVARAMADRLREATQIVFVQSAVPATALEVLPALAGAKGTVVRTELAAVADDIVRASEAFLNTRQGLKETLKRMQEELKGLHHSCAGKERSLSRAASMGMDLAATLSPGGGGAGSVLDMPTTDELSSLQVKQQTSPNEMQLPAGPPVVVLPKEALEHLAAHGKLPSASTLGLLSDMSLTSEDDVYAAEEAVLSFKEQSQVEKQDVELLIESNQKELGLHGDRVLSMRKVCDDLKKRLETDRYEHRMGMLDLRKTLEADLAALLQHSSNKNNNAHPTHTGAAVQPPDNTSSLDGGAAPPEAPHRRHHHQGTGVMSMVRELRSGATHAAAMSPDANTASTPAPPHPKKGSVPVIVPRNDATATIVGKPNQPHQQQLQQERTLEQLVFDLQRQRDEKYRGLEKATAALNKKRRSQEQLTELCEAHVLALRDYCEALHVVYDQHVQRPARATHSIDDDALALVPSFDEVKYIEEKLIRPIIAGR